MNVVSLFTNGVHTCVHTVVPSVCMIPDPILHSLNTKPACSGGAQSLCINMSKTPWRHNRLVPTISTVYCALASLCLTRNRQVSVPASGNKMNGLPEPEPINSPLVSRLGSATKLCRHPPHVTEVSSDAAIWRREISAIYTYIYIHCILLGIGYY